MNILERKFDENKTVKNYRSVAWFYNFWSMLTESKAANKVIELADIRDKQKILEIACGTGIVFEKIVKKNPGGFNTGIDLSPDMLKKAGKKLSKTGAVNWELKEGNVYNLEFAGNSFDIIINNFMIDLLPENTFGYIASEHYRILKPNGSAVISTFTYGDKFVHRFWFWLAKNMPKLLTGCRPVSFAEYLIKAGFIIEKDLQISQNTFPSEVIKARKPL